MHKVDCDDAALVKCIISVKQMAVPHPKTQFVRLLRITRIFSQQESFTGLYQIAYL